MVQGHIFSMTEYLAGLYLDSAIYSRGSLFSVPNRKMAPGRARSHIVGRNLVKKHIFMYEDLGIDLQAPCPEVNSTILLLQ